MCAKMDNIVMNRVNDSTLQKDYNPCLKRLGWMPS